MTPWVSKPVTSCDERRRIKPLTCTSTLLYPDRYIALIFFPNCISNLRPRPYICITQCNTLLVYNSNTHTQLIRSLSEHSLPDKLAYICLLISCKIQRNREYVLYEVHCSHNLHKFLEYVL